MLIICVAFWLRSSVVSVLFSLISEIGLRVNLLINLIFGNGEEASGLAYASFHCVTGLTLPPVDANPSFSSFAASSSGALGKKFRFSKRYTASASSRHVDFLEDWLEGGKFYRFHIP